MMFYSNIMVHFEEGPKGDPGRAGGTNPLLAQLIIIKL